MILRKQSRFPVIITSVSCWFFIIPHFEVVEGIFDNPPDDLDCWLQPRTEAAPIDWGEFRRKIVYYTDSNEVYPPVEMKADAHEVVRYGSAAKSQCAMGYAAATIIAIDNEKYATAHDQIHDALEILFVHKPVPILMFLGSEWKIPRILCKVLWESANFSRSTCVDEKELRALGKLDLTPQEVQLAIKQFIDENAKSDVGKETPMIPSIIYHLFKKSSKVMNRIRDPEWKVAIDCPHVAHAFSVLFFYLIMVFWQGEPVQLMHDALSFQFANHLRAITRFGNDWGIWCMLGFIQKLRWRGVPSVKSDENPVLTTASYLPWNTTNTVINRLSSPSLVEPGRIEDTIGYYIKHSHSFKRHPRQIIVTSVGGGFSIFLAKFIERAVAVGVADNLVIVNADQNVFQICTSYLKKGQCIYEPLVIYGAYTWEKFRWVSNILSAGVDVLWLDMDILLLANPLEYIGRLPEKDMWVTEHTLHSCINNGVFFVRSNVRTRHWFYEFAKYTAENPFSHDQNDFDAFLGHSYSLSSDPVWREAVKGAFMPKLMKISYGTLDVEHHIASYDGYWGDPRDLVLLHFWISTERAHLGGKINIMKRFFFDEENLLHNLYILQRSSVNRTWENVTGCFVLGSSIKIL